QTLRPTLGAVAKQQLPFDAGIHQRPSASADVAPRLCGDAHHQGVRRHVTRHDGPGRDQRVFTDRDTTADDRARAARGPIAHARRCDLPILRALDRTFAGDRAWIEIVREAGVRPNEYAVVDHDALEERRIGLYLHARADAHVGIHVDALPDGALRADA